MDSLPEYVEGTGCNLRRNFARLPTFKNFSSKCLEQAPERRVGAQSLLFTNLIHFLFSSGFFGKTKYWEFFRNNMNFMLTLFVSRFAIGNNICIYYNYVKTIIEST